MALCASGIAHVSLGCGFGVDLDGLAGGESDGATESDGQTLDGGNNPDVVTLPFVPAIQLTAGYSSTCALRKDGTVACWGCGDQGRLGDGKGLDTSVPSLVTGLSDATQISAGDMHVCAVKQSGAVACWGYDGDGQLGDGTQNESDAP